MARALQLEGPRSLRLCDEPAGATRAAASGKALLSGVSHGTELSLYRGTSAFADRVFDRDLRALCHAPTRRAATYPATLGYELVGRVGRPGGCARVAPGDLVHIGAPHREEATLDLDVAAASTYPPVRLPEDAPPERWLFVSVGAVALVAAHDAQIKLGDHVAVVGLGAIGLLLVQMARLAGARRVSRVDPVGHDGSSRSSWAPTRRSTRTPRTTVRRGDQALRLPRCGRRDRDLRERPRDCRPRSPRPGSAARS